MTITFTVFYVARDKKSSKGPWSIAGKDVKEPTDAARYVWDNLLPGTAHIGDKLYIFPSEQCVTFSVKGLMSLERDL